MWSVCGLCVGGGCVWGCVCVCVRGVWGVCGVGGVGVVCVGGGWCGCVCVGGACAFVCNLGLPVYFAQRLSCIRVIQNV